MYNTSYDVLLILSAYQHCIEVILYHTGTDAVIRILDVL